MLASEYMATIIGRLITNAGLTFNRQAGGLEVGNVAIDRADADFKMLSKFVGSADAAGPHLVD